MISVEEAQSRVLAPLRPLGAEQVPLSDALGRVLAQDLTARRTQPPSAISAMDGYAVRAEDLSEIPATLLVVGAARAGHGYAGTVASGQAVRIFTGAPVPNGADAVVVQEDTSRDGDWLIVNQTITPGCNIRAAGLDFRCGETGLAAGRRLTARDIGLAAAMNHPWMLVHRQPRVAILPTGDEVVMPGDPIDTDQIVSSNGLALGALVRAWGGVPVLLPIAPDDTDALQGIAAAATGIDILLTIGGASVGDHDLVRSALGADGLVLDFWQIAMRPGKPLIVGRYRDTPMIGLPGNPVSAIICALLFLKPAMDRLQGLATQPNPLVPARLRGALRANDGRQDYVRARISRAADGALEAEPFSLQDSSVISVLARADCLIVRAPHAAGAERGDPVEILPLGDGLI